MRIIIFITFILFAHSAFSSEVLVIVGGKAISDMDVERRVEALKLANPEFVANNEARKGILSKLVNEELCNNEARRLKLKVSREEVLERFEEIAKSSDFPKAKMDQLIKNKSLYDQVENQVLWNNLVSSFLAYKVKISNAEIREEQKIRKGIVREVTFKHIIFSTIDQMKLEEMRIEAQSCDSLGEITKKNNLPSPQKVSVLIDDLNPELQSIIKALPENRLSDVIKAGNHNQLIMVCHKNVLNNPSDVKQIKSELSNRKINAEAQKYLAELKKRIYIEYIAIK